MSYQLQVLADSPFSFWKLDGNGPVYADSAGSLRQADLVGSAVHHPALVAGSGNALTLNNTNRVEMDDPVFNKGYEGRQWSLEAWVKPVSVVDETSIMSHSNEYDGLVITPNKIIFRTTYTSAGDCEVSYSYRTSKAFHVVGVHANGRNSLYVDGQLIAETNLTDAQKQDSYAALTTDLIAGQSASGNVIAIDAPAIYAMVLSSNTIKKHYLNGIDVDGSEAIAGFNQATFWNFSDEKRTIALYTAWQTSDEWSAGVLTDTVVIDDTIAPNYTQVESEEVVDGLIKPVYTNTSIAGVWQSSVELVQVPESVLADARINWAGEGDYTLEYSLDNGTTWLSPTDAGTTSFTNEDSIDIRITFDGGIEDDPSYVSFLEVVVYTDKNYKGTLNNRFASLNGVGVASGNHYEPIEYAEINGTRLVSGTIDITDDSSYDGEEESPDQLYINGVELWMKTTPGNIVDAGARNITRVGDTIEFTGFSVVTVNGVTVDSGDTVFEDNTWYHIGGVFSTPGNYEMSIGSSGNIVSQLSAIYGNIDEAGLHQVYNAYLGIPGMTVNDSSTVSISQPTGAATAYAHVWNITSAG